MTNTLSSQILDMPSVLRFKTTLIDDLQQGRSLLVLLPDWANAQAIWSILARQLWHKGYKTEDVILEDLDTSVPPAAAVGKALQVQWRPHNAPRTVANLLLSKQLPDIISFSRFDEIDEATRLAWLKFVVDWSAEPHSSFGVAVSRPAVCVMAKASNVVEFIPENSVGLSVRWLWGFPSALEMHLLCRTGSYSDFNDPQSRWREFLLPAVSGNDLALADFLWDKLHVDVDIITSYLKTYGKRRGWTVDSLREWGAVKAPANLGNHRSLFSHPAKNLLKLWAHDVVYCTEEYGVELHSAALAILDRQEEVRRRIWRGQIAALLPLIDIVRLSVCEYLTKRYGFDWPVRWMVPKTADEQASVAASPLACELGYLNWILRKCSQLSPEQRWLPLVSQARVLRNELAHYRTVVFKDFENLIQQSRAMGIVLTATV